MLTRRRFVQLFGIGLPALASLRPARAQAVIRPRFVVFFETGGTISNRCDEDQFERIHPWDDWTPRDGFALGPLHQALAPHRDRLLFLSGIDNMAEPAEHERADLSALTARQVAVAAKGVVATGPSIDQVLAERLDRAAPVPFRSVDLVVPGPHYGEPSYTGPDAPIAREADPRIAFARLFADLHPDLDPAAVARLRAQKRSVLDGALGGFRALDAQLSAADRAILDAHQTRIRAIERRLELLDAVAPGPLCAPPSVAGIADLPAVADWSTEAREVVAPLGVDLMVHALACGLTHVATLHYPDTLEPFLPLPFQAVAPQPDGHALGHAGLTLGDPEAPFAQAWRAEMQANRRFKIGLVERMIAALAALPEGEGDLLSNTLILHQSEFSNAAVHAARDLPIMLAGNVAGRLGTGRHVTLSTGGRGVDRSTRLDYKTDWSVHNLHTSILRTFGFDDAHFGDDTAEVRGPLPL